MAARDATILVVDDDPSVRRVVERVLVDRGYNVLTAGDGAQALTMIDSSARPVDLLIVDMVLPGSSGSELATTIADRLPGIPLIKMSGMMDLSNSPTLKSTRQFLKKPFTSEELVRKVVTALEPPH